MTNKPDNRIGTIIEEIYQIDPSLMEYEADLSRLITALETNRPEVTVDQKFVRELRTSLLSYKPTPTPNKTPEASQFSWWFTRLAPVGISLVLFIVLVPDLLKSPTETFILEAPDSENSEIAPQMVDDVDSEMRMDAFMLEEADDDTSMMSMEATASSLQVAPPLAGDTLTITSLTMPTSGWVAVYTDQGGELGELLSSSFVAKGEYTEMLLLLGNELTYPGLVTVVVYTGNDSERFDATAETVQIDPLNDSPMMVTVPVISQLELELLE